MAPIAPALPSGTQWVIEGGGYRAVLVEVGGGIRALEHLGRPVLDPYPEDAIADGGHGQLLLPWPNRVDGGRYRWHGRDHQLWLTEPARGHAIHGLVRWAAWRAVSHEPTRLVVSHRLHPTPAYPFTLDLRVAYSVGEDGLGVEVDATNVGAEVAPYAAGAHPYLAAGPGGVDACRLTVPAATVLTVDERGIPDGRRVLGGASGDGDRECGTEDFRAGRHIGDDVLDVPYTDLERDAAGRATVTLARPDGSTIELWLDASHGYLMVFTGDTLADPARRRRGLAVEPMTAPPNALATGEALIALEPGATAAVSWGVREVGPGDARG